MSEPRVIRLTLPFAVLVPDNQRAGAQIRGRSLLTKKYRRGKEAARMLALGQVRGQPAFPAESLVFTAHVWMPDARRRDAANLRKMVTDALETVAYHDDSQIHDERWVRAGIDRNRPRVEIEIREATP